MQNSFDTSFIPQQPLLKVEGYDRRRESFSLAIVLALVAFFVVLFVAIGVYFFHRQVVGEVRTLSLQLQEKENSIDIAEIDRLKDVDLRIGSAKNLLKDHNVFTVILNFLEKGTLQNIGLTSLAYSNSDKSSVVSLLAQSPSYEAVYLQGETWRAMKPLVENVEISAVQLADLTGVVTFSAKITINRDLIRYTEFLKADAERRAAIEIPAAPAGLNMGGIPVNGSTSSLPVSSTTL